MININARNVTDAFVLGIRELVNHGEPRVSRGMHTLRAQWPVQTLYTHPEECVLFHSIRKPNHIFHLFEAIWILSGSNDVRFLSLFNSNMKQFSDNGDTFHAAYGYRLRRHFGVDQLLEVQRIFKKDPQSRRAVLQIWDVNEDLNYDSKDIPCNDLVFLSTRGEWLDMTVCCRSNDMIWGAYGANVVQFSVMLCWLAASMGMVPGRYIQFSNDFHVYTKNSQGKDQEQLWEALAASAFPCITEKPRSNPYRDETVFAKLKYLGTQVNAMDFLEDSMRFVDLVRGSGGREDLQQKQFQHWFFKETVLPVYWMWQRLKGYGPSPGGLPLKLWIIDSQIRSGNDWVVATAEYCKEIEAKRSTRKEN